MAQAIQCARPGSMIGYVGVPHGVELDGQALFFSQTGMLGGPAPVRRFLPHLMDLVLGAGPPLAPSPSTPLTPYKKRGEPRRRWP